MNEDLVYIRKKLDDIAEIVAESKIYIRTCNEERDIMFSQVRSLEANVTTLQTQSSGKNKTRDILLKVVAIFLTFGIFISGIVFWIFSITK